jgi:hypothetical protein
MQALLQKVWCAGLLTVLAAGGVRGDIVYTTSNVNSTTDSQANIITTGQGDQRGLSIGAIPVVNANTNTSLTMTSNLTAVRFTLNSALTGAQFDGIRFSAFIDGNTGSAVALTTQSAVATWRVYEGSSTLKATVTQNLLNMTGPGGNTPGTAVYQSGFFNTAVTGLVGGSSYTAILDSIALQTSVNNTNTATDIHWGYYNAAPVAGQVGVGQILTALSAGTLVGPGTGASAITAANLAFDVNLSNVAPVPEPGTLALGAIAALGGAGGWWNRRRKAKAQVQTAEEPAATV